MNRPQICRRFQRNQCRYGAQCRFEHKTLCPKFDHVGWCDVQNCPHVHVGSGRRQSRRSRSPPPRERFDARRRNSAGRQHYKPPNSPYDPWRRPQTPPHVPWELGTATPAATSTTPVYPHPPQSAFKSAGHLSSSSFQQHPPYSPTSPAVYNPTSPVAEYRPTSPHYAPNTPEYAPDTPQYAPTSPTYPTTSTYEPVQTIDPVSSVPVSRIAEEQLKSFLSKLAEGGSSSKEASDADVVAAS